MSSNIDEGLKNHHFSIILVKVYSGINYQWILNLEDKSDLMRNGLFICFQRIFPQILN